MSPTQNPSARHPTRLEQDLAVAVALWVMLAGMCVIAANAWATGVLPEVV